MKLKWNTASNLEFEVVKNLNGAVESLSNKKTDCFTWGKYTTKPIVDQKILRMFKTQLLQLNIISKKWTYDQLVFTP